MELNLIPDQEKRLIENWYRYDSEFLLSLLVYVTVLIFNSLNEIRKMLVLYFSLCVHILFRLNYF